MAQKMAQVHVEEQALPAQMDPSEQDRQSVDPSEQDRQSVDEDPEQLSSSRSGSSPSSRISVQKIFSVIAGFNKYKRFLVEEIGFSGVLNFPDIPKLNLKFSRWIMDKVDVASQTIDLGPSYQPLKFYQEDFHKVFGVPCGPRNIYGPDAQISLEAVAFIRDCIGLSDKSSHSLKVAEAFLQKEITEFSSKLEIDCFKMSLVIFVMGHLLAPSSKHDYTSVDYWGALRDTDNICRFNWCQYAMDHLLDAVTKLKTEIASGSVQVNNLGGCHLFFQIFLLDNVDLGPHNMRHNTIPRVQLFDGRRLKGMILMCTHKIKGDAVFMVPPVRHSDSVCYTRHNYSTGDAVHPPPAAKITQSTRKQSVDADQKLQNAVASHNRESSGTTVDFFRFLHESYPDFAGTPMGCALKQHNAKCLYMANQSKNAIIEENVRFAKKLIADWVQGKYNYHAAVPDTNIHGPVIHSQAPSYGPVQELHVAPRNQFSGEPMHVDMKPISIAGKKLDMSPTAGQQPDTVVTTPLIRKRNCFDDSYVFNLRANRIAQSSVHVKEEFHTPEPLTDVQQCSDMSSNRPKKFKVESPVCQEAGLMTHPMLANISDKLTSPAGSASRGTAKATIEIPAGVNSCLQIVCTPRTAYTAEQLAKFDKAVDPPPFDLGMDATFEVTSPPKPKDHSRCLSPASATKTYSDNLAGQLIMANDEIGDTERMTTYGQISAMKTVQQTAKHTVYCPFPMGQAAFYKTHTHDVADAIRSWIESTSNLNLGRIWVSHTEPRYISVCGQTIKEQLYGGNALDHELGALIVRRLSQLDEAFHRATPGRRSRALLEPDFSTSALAGEHVAEHASVQKQLVGAHLSYNIADCRFITTPAIMPHGWCTFTWDMQEREIIIIDPLAYKPDDGTRRKAVEYAADKLHEALFNCLQSFYLDCLLPERLEEKISTDDHYQLYEESGLCMLHIIRYFNGTQLTKPLTKCSITTERDFILAEILHMEGNTSSLQIEALDAVANASFVGDTGHVEEQ
ncbi:unnamed protein product [Alopecurus aequalis]